MGILETLLGSNPGILASLLGGSMGGGGGQNANPIGIPPGAGPQAPPGGVPSIPGSAMGGQGGLLGNGLLGNAARGALYGLGAAGQPGPSGFFAGVGRGAQQSIGMEQQRGQYAQRQALGQQALQSGQQQMTMQQVQLQQLLTQVNFRRRMAGQPPLSMEQFVQSGGAPTGSPGGGPSPIAAQAQGGMPAPQGQGGDQPAPSAGPQEVSPFQAKIQLMNEAIAAGDDQTATQLRQQIEMDPEYVRMKASAARQPPPGYNFNDQGKLEVDPGYVQGQVAEQRALLPGKMAVAQAGRTYVNTPTQIINQQEGAAARTIGEGIGKVYNTIQDAGLAANKSIGEYDRLQFMLGQMRTGKYAGTINDVVKSIKGVGLNPEALGITDTTSIADAAMALSRGMALKLRDPSQGGGLPGSMSEGDRNFLEGMVPGIETVPEAIPLITQWNARVQRRNIEVAKIAREYKNTATSTKGAGVIDDGVYDAIQAYSDAHPLFTDADRKKLASLNAKAGGPAAPPPAAATPPAGQFQEGQTGTTPDGKKWIFKGGQWQNQ